MALPNQGRGSAFSLRIAYAAEAAGVKQFLVNPDAGGAKGEAFIIIHRVRVAFGAGTTPTVFEIGWGAASTMREVLWGWGTGYNETYPAAGTIIDIEDIQAFGTVAGDNLLLEMTGTASDVDIYIEGEIRR